MLWTSGGDGGHVLFLMDDWQRPALQLVAELHRWAERAQVPLRIAGHVGELDLIRGADGRVQPVGDAINAAGWIVTRGSAAGAVVSSRFRAGALGQPGVRFHDERRLRLKHGTPLELWLMSLPECGLESRWSGAIEADRQKLVDAVEQGRGMDAVYYAKRLLQVNRHDEEVFEQLARLDPMHFKYLNTKGAERLNPVLGHLGPANLRDVIDQGQLVERAYNEVLCRRGDTGRSMFIILRGQIGVYTAEDGEEPDPARPRVTLSEGQIVGELAYALNRRRTADLVSLGDTALLSFEFDEVSRPFEGEMVKDRMNRSALEHVLGRLLGTLPGDDRLAILNVLRSDCDIISCPPPRRVTLEDVQREHGVGSGIYILAGGSLRSEWDRKEKILDGETFPLLYVDLPDLVVVPDGDRYVVVEGPAKIVYIGQRAIDALRQPLRDRLVRKLQRLVAGMYHYDAFIAYNFEDEPAAHRWEEALRRAGLRVFRDRARPGNPYAERDSAALLDSLTMLVLCSHHVQRKDADRNWLMKEVEFRLQHFAQPRIVPVMLPGGDPQSLELFYAAIRAENREAAAIDEAIELIASIRSGEDDEGPPCALRRHLGIRIA